MTDYFSVKILLNRNEAGNIIGLKGATIDDIRSKSKASIHLDRDKSKDRILQIKGVKGSVMKAVDHILDVFDEKSVEMGKKSMKFVMTDTQCKHLVSAGAKVLQQITRDSGTRIIVSPICLPCSEERVVKVEEGRGNIRDCMKQLYEETHVSDDSKAKPYQPPEERKVPITTQIRQTFMMKDLGTLYYHCWSRGCSWYVREPTQNEKHGKQE